MALPVAVSPLLRYVNQNSSSSLTEYDAPDKESEVLARITSFDIARIRTYLRDIRNIGDDVKSIFESSNSALALHQRDLAGRFREWFAHIVAIRDTPRESTPEVLAPSTYLFMLKCSCSVSTTVTPPGDVLFALSELAKNHAFYAKCS
jgi:hypothetical protein